MKASNIKPGEKYITRTGARITVRRVEAKVPTGVMVIVDKSDRNWRPEEIVERYDNKHTASVTGTIKPI